MEEDKFKVEVEELKDAHNRLTVVLRERQKRRRHHLASVEEFKDLVVGQKCGTKPKKLHRIQYGFINNKNASLDKKHTDKTDKSQQKPANNFEFKVPYPKKISIDGKYDYQYQDEKTIRNDYCQIGRASCRERV